MVSDVAHGAPGGPSRAAGGFSSDRKLAGPVSIRSSSAPLAAAGENVLCCVWFPLR